LLQQNYEKHHIFFNDMGFHNHIVHHLLTLSALNASPQAIQRAYDDNTYYQRPPMPVENSVIRDLHDSQKFKTHLGSGKDYNNFLAFFQQEVEKTSWQEVLQKYIYAGDEVSDDMFVRL
jgi:hypothetical protein